MDTLQKFTSTWQQQSRALGKVSRRWMAGRGVSRRWGAGVVIVAIALSGCAQPNSMGSKPDGVNPEAQNPPSAPTAQAVQSTAQPTDQPTDQQAVQYFAEDGIAIRGADPVAYFTNKAAVQGSSEFTHNWNGVTWQFASAQNRETFAANPQAYAPQYGGFCAWAVSQGKKAPIDPQAWKIVDGKLYLNYNSDIQTKWSKDIPGHIAKADQNWPALARVKG